MGRRCLLCQSMCANWLQQWFIIIHLSLPLVLGLILYTVDPSFPAHCLCSAHQHSSSKMQKQFQWEFSSSLRHQAETALHFAGPASGPNSRSSSWSYFSFQCGSEGAWDTLRDASWWSMGHSVLCMSEMYLRPSQDTHC